jgi:hypothetical protein
MLAMRVNKTVPGQGNVAVLSVAFLGIDNYVQFDIYADAASYLKYTADINSIISSYAFTPGFEYADSSSQPKKLTAANNLSPFESVALSAINVSPRTILVTVGGTLIIVLLLFGKKLWAKIYKRMFK